MKTTKPTLTVQWRPDRGNAYYFIIRWKGNTYRKATGFSGTTRMGWKRIPELMEQHDAISARLSHFHDWDGTTAHLWAENPPEAKKTTLSAILMELARVRNFSDHTFKNYSRALELYTERFSERIATQDETQGWAKELKYKFTSSSIWSYLVCLKSLFNYAVKCGYINHNPIGWELCRAGYKPLKAPKAREQNEVFKLLNIWDRTKNPWVGIWLASYKFCGLAMVDLLRVDFENIDIEEINGGRYYCFTIQRKKTNQTARCVTKVTPLTRELRNLMIDVRGWNMTCGALTEKVNRQLGYLKFSPKLTYYQARHTFATQLVQTGTPLNVIASLLGRNVRQIETYIAQIQNNQTLAKHVNALEGSDIGYLLR